MYLFLYVYIYIYIYIFLFYIYIYIIYLFILYLLFDFPRRSVLVWAAWNGLVPRCDLGTAPEAPLAAETSYDAVVDARAYVQRGRSEHACTTGNACTPSHACSVIISTCRHLYVSYEIPMNSLAYPRTSLNFNDNCWNSIEIQRHFYGIQWTNIEDQWTSVVNSF